MRRILIVGSAGAGKSTLSREVARRLDLPLIHLDRHYWQPGWVALGDARWRATVAELADRPAWVMDGNYGGTLDLRLPRADLLVFCDLGRLLCLGRVLRRRWAHRATGRPDLPPGCPETIDVEFLRYVWRYPRRSRPRLLTAVATHSPAPPVVRLRSRAEVRRWLDSLPPA
ncbi:adenylate kinase family enzyme [Micromonospora sp. M71_S20]|uniref:adenylate kinase n=1 Tax=Micromonospora sp. M71_S20 TaxID=592872 RepID=UPI000F22C414|nr:adenylate kinase [Micromonospora sp. M71_S20]RLK22917.1 adenylate kinase family enzyme [Micromonospora sp. M71_S20]